MPGTKPGANTHRIEPVDMDGDQLYAHAGFHGRTADELRPKPTESTWTLPKSGQIIAACEPALRLLRPLVDYAKTEAAGNKHDLTLLPLAVGEYEGLPPEMVYGRASRDIRHHEHYTRNSRGDDRLLKSHAQWLTYMTGVDYSPEDILITTGGIGACQIVIQFLTDPGDEICFVEPSWPNSKVLAKSYGRKVSTLVLSPEDNFGLPQTSQEWEERVPKTAKVLWLEMPSNPSGFGWRSMQEREVVAEFVAKRGILLFVDEEYRLLYADQRPKTILSLGAPNVIASSAWDKTLCMTSARLGSLETADPNIQRLLQPLGNTLLSAPNFMRLQQHIAAIMYDKTTFGALAYVEGLAAEIETNRVLTAKVLNGSIGIHMKGNAGFYDPWILPELRSGGAMQALMFSLVQLAQDERDGKQSEITVFSNAVPWAGFYTDKTAAPEGYRITLGRSKDQGLATALHALHAQVSRYIHAGQPYMGTPKEVVTRFLAGEKIEPGAWPGEKRFHAVGGQSESESGQGTTVPKVEAS
ncbi:MAG: pyridoxal phosphate-dependent aminotransferase [bacterium]|nr:pyridoxal phosphate-dependent aminotransferase [bacterium]